MESRFTHIGLLSLKKILEENFDDFNEIKVWGKNTEVQVIHRDDNFPVALAFNHWPKIKIKFPVDLDVREEKLISSLTINEKKYICLIENLDQINKELTFSESLYRSDMREEERLVCYPHRNVYVYTNCPKIEIGNLLEFKSPKSPELKKQIEFRKKFIKRSDKLEEGDVIGMRVVDLSSNGVSIVASREELELLENMISEMSFKINYMGEIFNLSDVSFVHSNNMILPGMRDSKLFKVGLSYTYNKDIFDKNSDLIDASITLEELEKELME